MLANARLLDYQADSLRMLMEQEDKGEVEGLLGHCVLTDPEKSGKSLVVLALIASRPLPLTKNGAISYVYDGANDGAQAYVSIRATVPNQVIRPTCIVAPSYAYHHWIDTIHKYTSFRAYMIATKKDARAFCILALNGGANDYDIVLVNYSQMRPSRTKQRGMFDICHLINCESTPMMWARVVYDNAHDLTDAMQMRAISAIYVSSCETCASNSILRARRETVAARDASRCANTSLRNLVCDLAPIGHIYSARPNGSIWATCGHDARTVARDAHLPDITWVSAIIGHLDDQTVQPDDRTRELMVSTHDDYRIDISSLICPPSELLAHILGDSQYDNYRIACARMIIMRGVFDSSGSTRVSDAVIAQAFHARAHYSETATSTEISCAQQLGSSNPRVIPIPRAIGDLTQEHRAQCDEVIKRCELIVARIDEHTARDECMVCYSPLHESDAIAIMRCCGICLCAGCCLSVMSARATDTIQDARGHCVQCRREIRLSDVVFTHYVGDRKLVSEMIEDSDEKSICAHHISRASCIKTKIDYIIELARSGCVPSDPQHVDARVYNGPSNSAEIDTTVATYGCARELVQVHAPVILVYSPTAPVLERVRYAARMESMRECDVILFDRTYAHQHMPLVLINAGDLVPVNTDMRAISMPWVTDIIVIDPISTEHMAQLINLTQCIGRTRELRVHMLEYTRASAH
jgi:hypothetical protein